jgi:hypothetical protein
MPDQVRHDGSAPFAIGDARGMIDNFALALSHGLLILAAWRLVFRADLDDDSAAPGPEPRRPFRKAKPGA